MSSFDWLREFLDELQLPDFYDAFRDILQVTQLQHFDYVRTSDLHRIGLSAPAIARIKNALKIHRENAGLPRNPHKKLHSFFFGIPLLDLLRYGPPRDAPILSPGSDCGHVRRCHSDVSSPSQSSSTSDLHLPCQLIRQEDVILHEIDRGRLGSGSFGIVRRGDWKTPNGRVLPVALKILRRNKTDDAADFFSTVLSEVMLMQSVSHPNLVRIYGIIPFNPLVIVTELAPFGSLLTALRVHSHRLSTSSTLDDGTMSRQPTTAFSVDILWDMSIQLARGMAHLAACCLIHRDLAARNILLFAGGAGSSLSVTSAGRRVGGFTVKIGDFGLLRRGVVLDESNEEPTAVNADLKGDEKIIGYAYVGSGKQKIPFAWSPPEAIQGRRFSQASDVWSWGVTVWEMWSGGAEPWPGLGSDAVLGELKSGRRLAWPRTACPRRLYQILLATWRFEPAQRPSFEYLVDRMDKIRPLEVVATQNFDEADRMDVMAGDRILVIDGRAANFWWRGQNRRTGEIAAFPREIVHLQRNLQSQDISRPIGNSFVHVGHHGFEGRTWGHVDRVEPAFLSGVTPHHADTLGHTYALQPSSFHSQSSWRPLGGTASSGNAASVIASTSSVAGFATEDSELDKDVPRVDVYDDDISFEDEDERRVLDASPHGIIEKQRLSPLSRNSLATISKLAKDLEASLRFDAYQYCMSSSSVPAATAASSSHRPPPSPSSPKSWSNTKTTGSPSEDSALSGGPHVPLIDLDRSAEEFMDRFPIPSAPIYQSHQGIPARNPYFQAAWNAWMRQSASPTTPQPMTSLNDTAASTNPDVERICRLFDATTVVAPPQCERQVLVGAAAPSNPFLAPQSSVFPEPQSSRPFNSQHFSQNFPESFNSTSFNTIIFDDSEVKMVAKRLPGGCSLAEAREALNCAVNSPTARDIIHPHTPPPIADVLAPSARDWRVKVALRLLLLRRLVRLQLCTDLETCWSALEKADWSVERAVNFLIYG